MISYSPSPMKPSRGVKPNASRTKNEAEEDDAARLLTDKICSIKGRGQGGQIEKWEGGESIPKSSFFYNLLTDSNQS